MDAIGNFISWVLCLAILYGLLFLIGTATVYVHNHMNCSILSPKQV